MEEKFTISLNLKNGYEFLTDFEQAGVGPLLLDEPEPLGDGRGPNAVRLLAAAVGNCLSASLLFCLRKARVEVQNVRTTVTGTIVRDEHGRRRVGDIAVRIEPEVAEADRPRMQRCLGLFEDYCVVTQSVRRGIDVGVSVETEAPARRERPAA